MAAQITIQPGDKGQLIVIFLYSSERVAKIKIVPGRQWQADKKHWTVPDEVITHLPRTVRGDKQLPAVLTREEVLRIFQAVADLKHRTILLVIYAAGLRIDDHSDRDRLPAQEAKPHVPNSSSYIFWQGEILDAMSRYRFMEAFNIGEFHETAAQIEDMFGSTLAVYDPDQIADMDIDETGKIAISAIPVFYLWLASRSTKLCSRIRCSLSYAAENWPGRIMKTRDDWQW